MPGCSAIRSPIRRFKGVQRSQHGLCPLFAALYGEETGQSEKEHSELYRFPVEEKHGT